MGLLALSKFAILPLLAAMLVCPTTALGSNQCPWHPSGPLGILEQCRVAYDPRTPSASSDWGPWTHKPVCVGPKAGKGTALCAFVKEDFRGEAGLLVVTSPEIAAADHSFVQDFDPRWLGYERQAARSDDGAPPFEVREVPGKKGLGAVANATIRAGDVVLREYPVLLHLAEVSEPVERMQALWVLEEGFIRLPIKDQRRVFDLSRSTGGHVLEDIIRTNTGSIMRLAHRRRRLGRPPRAPAGDPRGAGGDGPGGIPGGEADGRAGGRRGAGGPRGTGGRALRHGGAGVRAGGRGRGGQAVRGDGGGGTGAVCGARRRQDGEGEGPFGGVGEASWRRAVARVSEVDMFLFLIRMEAGDSARLFDHFPPL
ncbi:putative conserved hypothetical protein, partial [Colletotrichum sublineola]